MTALHNAFALFQSLLGGFGPWYVEDAYQDEEGAPYFEYGEINILDVESQSLSRHKFHVYPSEAWEEEIDGPSYASEITDGNILQKEKIKYRSKGDSRSVPPP